MIFSSSESIAEWVQDELRKEIYKEILIVSQVNRDPEIHMKYVKASAEYWGAKIGVKYSEPFSGMLIDGKAGGFNLNDKDFDYCSAFSGIDHIRTKH